jgi:threonine aldolase
MRAAMAAAEVGDDVLDGDPTVGRLEAAVAAWLGKEHALFVPSGTMANQVAVGVHTRPGDEVLLEAEAHMLRWESGALGALHGVQTVTLPSDSGAMDPERVRATIRPDFVHCPRTGLVCVEQTHMGAGGAVVPLAALHSIHAAAREAGVPVHMDGARLAHAVVASGVSASEWAACADTVSLCFSKGLGAPVGSAIAGDGDFRARALPVRKRLGGWMRQSGVLAAPALLALEEGVERLEEDHRLARALAETASRFPGLSCPQDAVPTNIAIVRVEPPAPEAAALAAALAERGILVLPLTPGTLRFVTHRDVGPDDVEALEAALSEVLGSP